MKDDSTITVLDVVQSWGPKSGGVKRYIRDKIKAFGKRGDVRHILVVPGGSQVERFEGRTKVYEAPSPPIGRGYRLLMNWPRIRDVIAAEKPDVVETDSAYPAAWMAQSAARRAGAAATAFYHSDFPRAAGLKMAPYIGRPLGRGITRVMEAYLRALYHRMDLVLAASERFIGLLHHMGLERTARVPLGVDDEVFQPQGAREKVRNELGLPDSAMLLLFVGRLADMKNIPELLAMMDRFTEQDGDVRLLVIGEGAHREQVVETAETRTNVMQRPYIADPHRLAEFYEAADLFVNPSLRETFGLVSLEAQACGTRVLGVKGGGMDETLAGENPPIMAPSPDPDDLADAVRRIKDLGEGREARRERRGRIVEQFSIDSAFNRLIETYRTLVAESAARRRQAGRPLYSSAAPEMKGERC
jgi:alpha-1,6-mannosyltransferase